MLVVGKNEVTVGIEFGCFAGFESLILNLGFVGTPLGNDVGAGSRNTKEGNIKRFHAATMEMTGRD